MVTPTGKKGKLFRFDFDLKMEFCVKGCTQYYTGTSNYFYSYNFAGGVQLANQKQTICMR